MIPVYDFLYKNKSTAKKTPLQEEALKHLLLNEVIRGITVDTALQKKIYALISVPEPDIENIEWRRDILSDFMRNPSLFDEINRIIALYDEICKNVRITGKGSGLIFSTSKKVADRDSSIFKMRSLADGIVKTLKLYEIIDHVLFSCKVYSNVFVALKHFFRAEILCPEFEELKSIASLLSASLNLDTSYTILLRLNKYFEADDSSIFHITSDPYGIKEIKTEAKINSVEYIGFSDETDLQLQDFVERGMLRLTMLLEHIQNSLKSPFEKMNEGLYFYQFALLLVKRLKIMALPVCLPSLSSDRPRFECSQGRDLWLALTMKTDLTAGEAIIPNDIIIDENTCSMIVRGENNAGKTVFLRMIGIMQIFAQAGLPISAQGACISPVNGIYAYFSAIDTGQGRFEEEVINTSILIDSVKKGDLVLFNEAFQSTAFDEAGDLLSDIILVLSLIGARTVAVTHLPEIKKKLTLVMQEYEIKQNIKYVRAETVNNKNTFRILNDNISH